MNPLPGKYIDYLAWVEDYEQEIIGHRIGWRVI